MAATAKFGSRAASSGELRAVKLIHRSRFSDARPFEREFEGIQRFEPIFRSHPSQLAILHVGKHDDAGCFYYVMELADDANGNLTPALSLSERENDSQRTNQSNAQVRPNATNVSPSPPGRV